MAKMTHIRWGVIAIAIASALAGCGGGGGSPGSVGGKPVDGAAALTAQVAMSLVDINGNAVPGNALSQTQARFVKIVAKTSAGLPISGGLVKLSFLEGASLVTLEPASGSALTSATGEARFRLLPSSVSESGAIVVQADVTSGEITGSNKLNVQTNAGNVALSGLTASPTSVQKGQAVNVSVAVQLDGAVAPSNSVSVTFSSSCGDVSPPSALVDSTGRASAVIQTKISGACTVNATANGAVSPSSAAFTVTEPPITALQFVSATPPVIYQANSPGVNTSLVKFQLVNSVGNPVQGSVVRASLSNTDGGVTFCGSPQEAPTDATGSVTFSVCAGTLPTTLQVRAELSGTPTVFTNSNRLTVQTGLPTQRFFDLSASQFNYYVGAAATSKVSGNKIRINAYLADRQANPVPDGTPVVFVAEGGQLITGGNSSCIVTNGGCSVELIGQDYRPWGVQGSGHDARPGRVTVLAYADGEESFVDANGDNRYTAGEAFEDLGRPYLDKTEDRKFTSSFTTLQTVTNDGEQQYPMPNNEVGRAGVACDASSELANPGLSVANTCDGVWTGAVKVRRSLVVVFSGGEIGQPPN